MTNNEHNHEHSHEGHHHHSIDENISLKKITGVTILNATITITEIIGGILSGSLSLLSDALHNLSDTVAIILSYVALVISRKEKNEKKSYGYKRAGVLAAFINSTALIVISFYLLYEAYKRFINPETINGNLMIIVAVIGLVSNFISVLLLEKDSKNSMNLKASYLHLLGDTVSSVGVVIGGIVIKFWNIYWIDPLVTVLISIYILKESYGIFKQTIDILMQSTADLDYEDLKKDVENIDGVINIHHIHTWMSDEKTIYFEGHVILEDMLISNAKKIHSEIEEILENEFGISHITIQFEAENEECETELFKI
ncbi:cation diffusion facilitator family transporter [Haliovirga abyssi]|uniref:Cobalt transporter n=1 Tax=Haliovirga abyssi TaxID=2996794 RepID=A0AAU9DC17_9FUSO|nr:cation diffusion facilitator family transporter [Haliovirga abyssi]BDU49832.1 cobalt transporter [Haliovirga abyssi]